MGAFTALIPNVAVPASTEAVANAKLDFDTFMRLVNTAHNAKASGKKTSAQKIVDFLKANSKGSYDPGIDLAKDAIFYLETKSNKFSILQLTELVEWLEKAGDPLDKVRAVFCKDFHDPKVWKHLNEDWFKSCHIKNAENAAASVQKRIDDVVEANNAGGDVLSAFSGDAADFGETVETCLKIEALPLPYLALLEKADYREQIAPWSLIRRSIMAYETPKDNPATVEDEVVAWLDHAHLVTALYGSDDDTMKELLASKVRDFASRTIGNPNWVKHIYDEVVGYGENDRAKALQCEFDMWLLHALSPAVGGSRLPLSPHAFNTGKDDESHYNRVFGSWLRTLKQSASERREVSIRNLSGALDGFYKQVAADWKKDCLDEYEPRIPSVNSIMAAATRGDKDRLFGVLVADVEQELGVKVPEDVKASLVDSPYFNSIYREIRFQSVKV